MIALPREPVPAVGAHPVAITLFGPPQVTVAGRPLALTRRQARALLYRIAAATQPLPRDQLAFLLWPDVAEATARRNLTVLVSQVRLALPPAALVSDSAGIALDPALVQVDIATAAALATAGQREGRLDQLAAAANLYRGPFLDGVALPEAEEFQSWLTHERQHWERWQLDLLSALVEGSAAAGDYATAIAASQRALASREQLFPVPPLPVPDLASLPPPEELAVQPAVALLLARAQALNPRFVLTVDNAADLAALCVHLDGLPLALELAAARLRLLAPRELLKRPEHRLALLTEGPAARPARAPAQPPRRDRLELRAARAS